MGEDQASSAAPTARVCPDNGKAVVCFAIRQTDTVQANLSATVAPNGYGPADLRSAYHLTGTGGAATTVAIIDAFDDPNAESDLATYTAVNTAVSLGARFISNSYGGPETGSENSFDNSYYNHPGVVITASSGDDGFGVSYPASGKGVVAVGGTSLTRDTSPRGWSETVWAGAGSGCSGSVAKPVFQVGLTTGCAKRAEADVAAVADPQTGVAVYQTYGAPGWTIFGGTSAAAPIIASVYALAGDPGAGDSPNSYPYAHAGALYDVVTGTNGACGAPLCTAGAGYDGPTGLGTPQGVLAFSATPAATTTTITTSTNPSTLGQAVAFTATISSPPPRPAA